MQYQMGGGQSSSALAVTELDERKKPPQYRISKPAAARSTCSGRANRGENLRCREDAGCEVHAEKHCD